MTETPFPDGHPDAPPVEPGHDVNDGLYVPQECEPCVERTETARNAERKPRIKELWRPIWDSDIAIFEGRREVGGYLLSSRENGGACAFFDRRTRLCAIYDTRPLVCRLFNCDVEQRRFEDESSAPS